MAVKFCFTSGYFPKPIPCGMEAVSYPATYGKEEKLTEMSNNTPVRLGDLGFLEYETHTSEFLKARVEVAMSFSDDKKDIWRLRIISILARAKTVFCINFIPANPYQPQILQVMRMNNLEEDAAPYRVYCYDSSPYKLILPKEHPDQVFDLSQWQFAPMEKPTYFTWALTRSLQYLKNEKALKGMALTLQAAQGDLKTYVWIKPADEKYWGLRPECHLADLHMVVKFCYAACNFPKEAIPGRANSTPIRLSDLGPLKYKTYFEHQMGDRLEKAMSLSDDMKNIWRHRIICILGIFEKVFCINFIPSNPQQLQSLQVMRMKDLTETAGSYPVYCCDDFSPYKLILPKEHPDQVFDLSQWDFSHLDPTVEYDELIEGIALALYYLKKEKRLQGMALTLQIAQGVFKTYVWINPTDMKYRVLRHECHLAG